MRIMAVTMTLVALRGCDLALEPRKTPVVGTWGGENAGLIATDSTAHVHIGCTLGDTKSAIVPGPDGAFSVTGLYNITAYPVYRGPDHPARFVGRVDDSVMTLTVSLTDTSVTLGPVQLVLGKEPRMGPCPICRTPKPRR